MDLGMFSAQHLEQIVPDPRNISFGPGECSSWECAEDLWSRCGIVSLMREDELDLRDIFHLSHCLSLSFLSWRNESSSSSRLTGEPPLGRTPPSFLRAPMKTEKKRIIHAESQRTARITHR